MSKRRLWTPDRRTFLRGAGVTLALPFLHSALPRASWGDEFTSPTRMMLWFVPNGLQRKSNPNDENSEDWWVVDDGADGDLSYKLVGISEKLESVVQHVSILSGLKMDPAVVPGVAGDHARGTGSFLTCTTIKKTASDDIHNAISMDQVAAQAVGGETIFPSLQVGIQEGGNTGDCTAGYSCAYTRNLAWASPTVPLPNITDPAILYNRLFGIDTSLSPELRALRKASQASILHQVNDEIASLNARLGSADRQKLEQYLEAVGAVEQRVSSLGGGACGAGEPPPSDVVFATHVDIMSDLMLLALSCDLTRVVTFMLGPAASNQTFDFLGVPGAHHEISHHQGDQAALEELKKIAEWEVEKFAGFVQKLAETPDGNGFLIDSTLAYFSSEIDNGDTHNHDKLTAILAGSGNGAHTPQRHINVPGRPMADLFLSMLHAIGVDDESFGDSTGPIDTLVDESFEPA
jgi:hypothetical protein